MEQIDNYISRILQNNRMNSALILTDKDSDFEYKQLTGRLRKYPYIDNIYGIDSVPLHTDLIIFDTGCEAAVKKCKKLKPLHLIGRMSEREDYFGLWEQFRNISQSIYVERKSEAGKTEILEWHKADADMELSIIIPVYNIAKYLPRCIETLTGWKASYVEFIFVDDGSTDTSSEIIQEKMRADERIKLVRKTNGGCASARNMGIQVARGRYLGFVDGDDFMDERMYPELLKRAMLGNYDFTYCGYAEYSEENQVVRLVDNDYMGEPYRSGTYRRDKVQFLAVNTRVAIWRCLYKKEILQQYGIMFHEDLRRFDDLPFKVEYVFAAKSAVCIPRHLYYYRLGRQGQDSSCNDEGLYVHFEIFRHLDEFVKEKNNQRMLDLLQVVKMNTYRYALSVIRPDLKKAYAERVRKELADAMGYCRSISLAYLYTGWKGMIWFIWLWVRR